MSGISLEEYDRRQERRKAKVDEPTNFSGKPATEADAARLPAALRRRLGQFEDAATALGNHARAISDKRRVIASELAKAKQGLDQLRNPRAGSGVAGGGFPETDSCVVRAIREVAELEEDHRRITDEANAASSAFQVALGLFNACDAAVAAARVRYRADQIPMHAGVVTVDLKKGQSAADYIEERRRRIRELDADRHRVRSAPRPAAEAKRLARIDLERLAAAGAPAVHELVEAGGNGRIAFAEDREVIHIRTASDIGVSAFDIPAMAPTLAWLFKTQLAAAIDPLIDAEYGTDVGMSEDQRAAKLAEIAADKLAAERQEEHAIRRIEESGAGLSCARRPDADPRALLDLADSLPAPKTDD